MSTRIQSDRLDQHFEGEIINVPHINLVRPVAAVFRKSTSCTRNPCYDIDWLICAAPSGFVFRRYSAPPASDPPAPKKTPVALKELHEVTVNSEQARRIGQPVGLTIACAAGRRSERPMVERPKT